MTKREEALRKRVQELTNALSIAVGSTPVFGG